MQQILTIAHKWQGWAITIDLLHQYNTGDEGFLCSHRGYNLGPPF
jgi:hypothetical protein